MDALSMLVMLASNLLFVLVLPTYQYSETFFVRSEHVDHEYGRCTLRVPSNMKDPTNAKKRTTNDKIIIAHRGESFSLPEHTLEGYRLALELGTDYIEPDLVFTKDGKLIAMHTIDLNITTDVATKFPNRKQTLSSHVNKTGYWTYDFTLEEIETLSLKQRLETTGARTSTYDGKFKVPTFQQILELLYEWNSNVLPLLDNMTITGKKRSGVYVELKEAGWLEAETNKSLVNLLLSELEEHTSRYNDNWILDSYENECKHLQYNEYLVPPLVVQSFEGDQLQRLHDQWHIRYNTTTTPPPPAIILVDVDQCTSEEFWYQLGKRKTFIMGIGPNKECLRKNDVEERPFLLRSKEHNLVVHPWTIRSELQYVLDEGNFANVDEELTYLFCEVGVDGVFTESVDAAVRIASTPCPGDTSTASGCGNDGGKTPIPTSQPTTIANNASSLSSYANNSKLCYETDKEAQLYVGVASLFLGGLIGIVGTLWISSSRLCKSRRHRRRQLSIPTQEENVESSTTMTTSRNTNGEIL